MSSRIFSLPNFPDIWRLAAGYAGETGRIATIKDIVKSRVESDIKSPIWQEGFGITSSSSEYIGLSKSGIALAVVCHGNGPLSTLDDWMRVYDYHIYSKDGGPRDYSAGYIPDHIFHDLIEGKYGDVDIFELSSHLKNNGRLDKFFSKNNILENPWTIARLGGDVSLIEQYAHKIYESSFIDRENEEYIVRNEAYKVLDFKLSNDAVFMNCRDFSNGGMVFNYDKFVQYLSERKIASSKLLGVSELKKYFKSKNEMNKIKTNYLHLYTCVTSLRSFSSQTIYLAAIKDENLEFNTITLPKLINNNIDSLIVPHKNAKPKFEELFSKNNILYTTKKYVNNDFYRACHPLNSSKMLKEEIIIISEKRSTCFPVSNDDYKTIVEEAPDEANAFLVYKEEKIEADPKLLKIYVKYYKVDVDYSKRILNKYEVVKNVPLMLKLIEIEASKAKRF